MEPTDSYSRGEKIFKWTRTALTAALLIALLILCLCNRDKISVSRIVNYAPRNKAAAVLVMLLLFTLKSFFVTVYGGILYTASGIMFSLPLAIAVNTVGTALMTGVPFLVGKLWGTKLLEKLTARHPKLRRIVGARHRNEFLTCFIVRMVGLLPADLVGMYFGARDYKTGFYAAGTLAGLFPSILAFSVMGMEANNMRSPLFWAAAGVEIGITAISVAWCFIRRKAGKEDGE